MKTAFLMALMTALLMLLGDFYGGLRCMTVMPSDVKAILDRFPAEELPAVATFGEGTLRAAVDAGIKVKAMAPTPTVPSMAKAVDIYLTKLAKGEQIEDVAVTHDADKEEFIRTQQHKLAKKSRTRRTTPAEKK